MTRPSRAAALALLLAVAAAAAAPSAAAAPAGDPAELLVAGARVCMNGGPLCCSMLNTVFGDPEHPVSKCMCMARVMASIELSGFSLQGMVATCAASRDMRPAAAFLQRQADTCPAGAHAGGAAAPAAGSPGAERVAYEQRVRPLLRVALGDRGPAWALSNIGQGLMGGPGDAAIGAMFRAVAYNGMVWTPVAGAAVFCLALAVHAAVAAVAPLRRRLHALPLDQRLVSYQHLLFAAIFAIQVVPYTVLFARFFFMRWTAEYFVGSDDHVCELGVVIGLFIMSHAFLYCLEGALRVLVKPSPVLLVHHFLFFFLLCCGLWMGPSALLIKTTVVLDLFAVHELPLYVALLLYRLCARAAAVRGVMVAALAWYGLTRVAQTGLLVWLLAASDAGLRTGAPFIISVIVCSALTGVQAYTFHIYAGMYRRAGASRAVLPKDPAASDDADAGAGLSPASSDDAIFVATITADAPDAPPAEGRKLRLLQAKADAEAGEP